MRHTFRKAAFALTLSLALATQAFAVASGGAPRPDSSIDATEIVLDAAMAMLG